MILVCNINNTNTKAIRFLVRGAKCREVVGDGMGWVTNVRKVLGMYRQRVIFYYMGIWFGKMVVNCEICHRYRYNELSHRYSAGRQLGWYVFSIYI